MTKEHHNDQEEALTQEPPALTEESQMGYFLSSSNPDDPIYQPAPNEQQLTLRALAIGIFFGCVVSATNIYFGLKIGWSFGASITAAILSYACMKFLPIDRIFTPLETNIAQTAGSAAGSMASAAGFLAPIPAMEMLGYDFTQTQLVLWAASVSCLGVFFAVPLRRQMVVEEKLRFPSGTATGETIRALYAKGSEGLEKSRALFVWAGIAFGLKMLSVLFVHLGLPDFMDLQLQNYVDITLVTTLFSYGFTLYWSPVMLGAGVLMGMRTCASLAFGAILAWGIIAPLINHYGIVTGPIMDYGSGARGWILWPGVALMVTESLTALALSWKTFLRTFQSIGQTSDSSTEETTLSEEAIPNSWWMGGLALGSIACSFTAHYLFEIEYWVSILAIGLSAILASVAVRATGETDINPIGGMGKVTQILYGAIQPGSIPTNLMTAAITGSGASQAGDMMHDLKTGHMLQASPRKQFIAQIIGIFCGIFTTASTYVLFSKAFDIGGDGQFPAPAAHAWKAMAELLTQGLEALPNHAVTAVIIAIGFGILGPLIKKFAPKNVSYWWPSGLAVGIAFIVPAYYSMAMFYGAVIAWIWQRADFNHFEKFAFTIASGAIAGEGIGGLVDAVVQFIQNT